MIPEAGAFFGRRKTKTLFSERGTSDSFTPYVLRSAAVSLQLGWFEEAFEEAEKVGQLVMEAAGVNGCQGTPWSEELDGKEFLGVAWRRVRSGVEMIPFFLHSSSKGQHVNPTSIHKCGIIMVLRELCFLQDFSPIVHMLSGSVSFLVNCAFVHTKKFASPNPHVALFAQRVFSREGCPR